jgi:hypothetical protein
MKEVDVHSWINLFVMWILVYARLLFRGLSELSLSFDYAPVLNYRPG